MSVIEDLQRRGQRALGALGRKLPVTLRETILLRTFGVTKIPLLFFSSPTVLELSDQRCVVKIPLSRLTRNHLRSMYFAALAAGADCAGGLIAMRTIRARGGDVHLIFKSFKADFMKRAEGDVHFTCEEGEAIAQLVDKALQSSERVQLPVHVTATVPTLSAEPVAKFTLVLSLKKKGRTRLEKA